MKARHCSHDSQPYELYERWSDELADYEYVFVRVAGKKMTRIDLDDGTYIETPKKTEFIASGDFEWAKRITEHYGLAVNSVIRGADGKIQRRKYD